MTDDIHEEIINETIRNLKHCDYDGSMNLVEIIGEERVHSALMA